MAIFLLRHGETLGNRDRIVQLPETPLSERGRLQAARVAARLASEGVARILASDLARAAMTAETVGRATGIAPELDALLQERNFGDLRGTPYAELDADIFAPGYAPPAGESWEQFHARVDSAWERVTSAASETRGNLVVVTHGLVCYSLALRHLRLPAGANVPVRWGNTAVTIVEAEHPYVARVVNCTVHLDGDVPRDAAAASRV